MAVILPSCRKISATSSRPLLRVDNARAEDSCCHHHCCSSDTDSESIWRCAVWPLIAMDSTAMRMAMP